VWPRSVGLVRLRCGISRHRLRIELDRARPVRQVRPERDGREPNGGPRSIWEGKTRLHLATERKMAMRQSIVAGLLLFGTLGLFKGECDAGLHHTKSDGACSDCHKPRVEGQFSLVLVSLATTGTRPSVPVPTDVNRTCLGCHGGKVEPSVVFGASGNVIRQAGFLRASGGPMHTGHTLGSTERAPGGTWTPGPEGLVCTDCHDPHGENGQYRNLVLRPGSATEDRRIAFVLGVINDPSKDVWIKSGLDGTGKYDARNIYFNQPQEGRSAYGDWCQGCHTNMHAGATSRPAGARGWRRHPTSDARIGSRGFAARSNLSRFSNLDNRVPTMSASGQWPGRDNTPSCMSCHKAHGNANPFGLLYMAGQGQLTEDGDSRGQTPIDLCHQCHTQGLSARP